MCAGIGGVVGVGKKARERKRAGVEYKKGGVKTERKQEKRGS